MELNNNTIWERCSSKCGKALENLKKVQTKVKKSLNVVLGRGGE
jgi:hypothetical protein